MIPDSIAALPMPTIVARQSGEAWKRPFVAVFEPSTGSQPKSVVTIRSFDPIGATNDFVGLVVESKGGTKEYIFSATVSKEVKQEDKSFIGTYGVISERDGSLSYLFLGNGKKIEKGAFGIAAISDSASAALTKEKDGWYVTTSQPVTLILPIDVLSGKTIVKTVVNKKPVVMVGKKGTINGKTAVSFELPVLSYTKIEF
jgi:hypothetical protein